MEAQLKNCLICQESKPLGSFSPCPTGRNGLHPWCHECKRAYSKARYHNQVKPLRKKSATIILPYVPRPSYTDERAERPGYAAAESAWRRCKELGCIPPWVRFEDVLPIYEMCGRAPGDFTVDHIVPLLGPTVSGLHVPWNLQLLTRSENSRKNTKLVEHF